MPAAKGPRTLDNAKPIASQFFAWIVNMAEGDFGSSLISQRPVLEMIGQRIGPTLALAVMAMIFTVVISLPLGVLAAWRHGGMVDRFVMALSVVGFSVPIFVIGYVLIAVFAVNLKWFPVQGYKPLAEGFGQFLHRILLPGLALSFFYIALVSRMTRASMLEVLREDYVRTARAKGLSPARVIGFHALRNAHIPVVPTIGLQVG